MPGKIQKTEVRLINLGDFISPDVTNRPHQDTDQNIDEIIRYLEEGPLRNFEYDIKNSSGLSFKVMEGLLRVKEGVLSKSAATINLTENSTNYIYTTKSGPVASNISGFPSDSVPLYKVSTSDSEVTSVVDMRTPLHAELGDEELVLPDATTSQKGVIKAATDGAALVGSSSDVAITPSNLKYVLERVVPTASETEQGKLQLATDDQTVDGVEGPYAVTPSSLAAWWAANDPGEVILNDASLSTKGIVQLSNSTNVNSDKLAATASAVKAAYDVGNHAHPYAPEQHSHDASDLPRGSTSERGILQLVDSLTTAYTDRALTAKQGKVLKELIEDLTYSDVGAAKSSHSHSASDLPKSSTAAQGIVRLVDSLTTTYTDRALTAKQGKVLYEKIQNSKIYGKTGKNGYLVVPISDTNAITFQWGQAYITTGSNPTYFNLNMTNSSTYVVFSDPIWNDYTYQEQKNTLAQVVSNNRFRVYRNDSITGYFFWLAIGRLAI